MEKIKIAIADDNRELVELMTEFLESQPNMEVVGVAYDGRECIGILEQTEADILLLDIIMPVLDGYETTRRLRADPRFADLPVIAMTADAMSGDKQRALASGMNDYVAKPFVINEMFAVLSRWIGPRLALRRAAQGGTPPDDPAPPHDMTAVSLY